jgi:hypothetical protein
MDLKLPQIHKNIIFLLTNVYLFITYSSEISADWNTLYEIQCRRYISWLFPNLFQEKIHSFKKKTSNRKSLCNRSVPRDFWLQIFFRISPSSWESQKGRCPAAIIDTGGNLRNRWENLPPVSLIPVVHLDLRISPEIFEKFGMTLMLFSGAWEKTIHEKQKSRDTVPLHDSGLWSK